MARPATPLVSVITPVFNGAEYLEELIASVRDQDYPSFEHIVIDDGSRDGGATVRVLEGFPHLRWWTRANRGQLHTLNEGLAQARGEIVSIISADDRYVTPDAFSTAVAALQARPELGLVYGSVRHIGPTGEPLPFETFVEPRGPFSAFMLRHRSCIYHCSMFVWRRLVTEAGIWFDPTLRLLGDWDWFCRLLESGVKAGFVAEDLSEYRDHPMQITGETVEAAWRAEARAICLKNGASPGVALALRRLFRVRHRVLRACWLLRTGGFGALGARVLHRSRGRGHRAGD